MCVAWTHVCGVRVRVCSADACVRCDYVCGWHGHMCVACLCVCAARTLVCGGIMCVLFGHMCVVCVCVCAARTPLCGVSTCVCCLDTCVWCACACVQCGRLCAVLIICVCCAGSRVSAPISVAHYIAAIVCVVAARAQLRRADATAGPHSAPPTSPTSPRRRATTN